MTSIAILNRVTNVNVQIIKKVLYASIAILPYGLLAQSPPPHLVYEDNKITLTDETSKRTIGMAQTAKLFYTQADRQLGATNETYLIFYSHAYNTGGNYPIIIDHFEGHGAKLEYIDLNQSGNSELLLYHNAGANLRLLRVYLINSLGAKCVQGEIPVSNTQSIILKDNLIITENSDYTDEGSTRNYFKITKTYALKNGEIVKVKENTSPVNR